MRPHPRYTSTHIERTSHITSIMSIFEHDKYELDYQRYLDWKNDEEEEQRQMEEYLDWEEARQNADNEAAERYLAEVERERERERETTGERIVREVANELSVIHEEDEVIEKQMAQITVDGVFRYDLYWLPETNEVRVEIDTFRSGEQMYYYYPDEMPITKTLGLLMSCEEKDLKIEGLGIFGEGRESTETLPYELECFLKSTWHDYASEGFAVQFNINTKGEAGELDTCGHAEDDYACSAQTCGRRMTKAAFVRRLEELQRNNHPTRHGLDGTQCDCDMCTRANDIPADVEPYHESVDEDRLPTVYECLNMPKRISDALIRNWVAKQPDEDKACSQAAELSETVRMIAGNSST